MSSHEVNAVLPRWLWIKAQGGAGDDVISQYLPPTRIIPRSPAHPPLLRRYMAAVEAKASSSGAKKAR